MAPEQIVVVSDVATVRAAVHQYIADNAIWRAEDHDMVWSDRFMSVKLSLLAGQHMTFGELVATVQSALLETTHPRVRSLTANLIAEKICSSVDS